MFGSCETLDDCQDCLTAFMGPDCTCGLSVEGAVDADNLLLLEHDVDTESDCKGLCAANASCNAYTYYDAAHTTYQHLCMLLTSVKDPVKECENCQSGPDRCEAFHECSFGFFTDGVELYSRKFFSDTSKTISYVAGEDSCSKTVISVAVGSGGPAGGGGCASGYGGGGGSGFVNSTEFVLPSNKYILVDIGVGGVRSSVTLADSGEVLLSADNAIAASPCYNGGDGYSGGGGTGRDGGTGGDDGDDGKTGTGGTGSGFDFTANALQYYKLSDGKGGDNQGDMGGGGGGVLVDSHGPDQGGVDGYGEGYGGGAAGKDNKGLPGCVVMEIKI